MRRLTLKRGLSYSMRGFSCVKEVPFYVDDDIAGRLMNTGRFDDITAADYNEGQPAEPEAVNPTGPEEINTAEQGLLPGPEENLLDKPDISAELIEKMKKDELIALAENYNINISDCKNNEERVKRIQGALGVVSFAQMGFEC